ncbi:MAG: TnsA endonuclease N-terminal domain-containing protein [Negativicutes bacterium]|nr:TnsA endonuclease N-terminal domain-containing protein [Negativicutes bacterium]
MYVPILNGSKRYGNNRWLTYSPKLKRSVWLYSDLEYDHWILVETNPRVKSFCEQPLRIRRTVDGYIVETIFDMWILFIDEEEKYIEVKYSNQIGVLRTTRQIRAQQYWCSENGHEHLVQTEIEIRNNIIYLENMKKILYYSKQYDTPSEYNKGLILAEMDTSRKVQLNQIIKAVSTLTQNQIIGILSALCVEGSINANLNEEKFGFTTEVWLNG